MKFKKKIILVWGLLLIAYFFSACSTNSQPNYKETVQNQQGIVVDVRKIKLQDGDMGRQIGAALGSLLGAFLGDGDYSGVAIVGGSIAGGYAGSQLLKSNANELTISLDEGDDLIIISKDLDIKLGDRVEVIQDGDNEAQVNKIDY